MLVYVIENLYNKYKTEFDELSNQIRKELDYSSIDNYFKKFESVEVKYQEKYLNILKSIRNTTKSKEIKELANISLHCENKNYLLNLLKTDLSLEGELYTLYHLITNHYIFNKCKHLIDRFNNRYNRLSKKQLTKLSPRLHIAKIMIDGDRICRENKDYKTSIKKFIQNKNKISEYNSTEYLTEVLNQHVIQFLDIYFRRNCITYTNNELIIIQNEIRELMKKTLYFKNYELSPFYADIEFSFYCSKKYKRLSKYIDWTLKNYIKNCESNVFETVKILTQHNYINIDFYNKLKNIDKEGIEYV